MKIDDAILSNEYSPWKFAHHKKELKMLKEKALFPPKNIQIDLEAWCPHDCSFCTYRNAGFNEHGMKFYNPDWAPNAPSVQTNHPKGRIVPDVSCIPKDVALNLPSQMADLGIPSIEITGGGESLAYAWFAPFLKELNKNMIDVAIVTNGQFLSEKLIKLFRCLEWMRFSMDACTALTYARLHGVEPKVWYTVLANIQKLLTRKRGETVVGVSFVITRVNLGEIADAAYFWKKIGADNIRFTFAYDRMFNSGLNKEELEKAHSQLDLAKEAENGDFKVFAMTHRPDYYSASNNDFDFCGYQFFTWAIGYNAKVYPCCIQKYYEGYELGDLKNQSLREIVYGSGRNQYIESFDVRKCKPCWLRDKNKFLEYLLQEKPRHINFT